MEELLNIEKVLETAAENISTKTFGKCLGIVTTSSIDEKNQTSYSLYIYSPKIKDYSYHLINSTTKGGMSLFPIDSVLFTKEPKKNQYITSTNLVDFQTHIDELITHKLTDLLINHLINLADLKDEYQPQRNECLLSKNKHEDSFPINSEKRELHFNKLTIISHLDSKSSEWLSILLNSSINFECNFKMGGSVKYNLPLITLVSPYTVIPVFDLNLYFPSYNDLQRFKNEDGKCTVKLMTDSEELKIQINYDQNILVKYN